MSCRQIGVVDATVVEVNPEYKSGLLRIEEPERSQIGIGYIIFNDNEVATLPLVVTVGRQCRCEVWSQKVYRKYEARNLWFYVDE